MGPTTKKKNADGNDDNNAKAKKLEKALREGRADAKEEFESQRSEIFNALSASYKQMFGQIIFAKWKKIYLPALVLSPYSVPPGPVRTMWMEKFEKLKAKNMLDQMIYLIYWYGSKSDGDFYGFVSKSNFFTYKQEAAKGAKGIHVLPAKLQEKMNDTSAKLTSMDEDMIRTYQEMEEDLLKDPSDRKRGVLSFLEGYEMLSYEDLDEIDVDESSSESSSDNDNGSDDEDEDGKIEDKKPKAIAKKSYLLENVASITEKKKKNTKTVLEAIDSKSKKKNKYDDNNHDDDDPNAGKVTSTSMKKKRSRISMDAEDSLLAATAKKKKKPKKDKANTDSTKSLPPAPLVPISDSAAVLSDGIGENDEDDEDVEDQSVDEESSAEMEHDDGVDDDDDDDKDDRDFVENVVESNRSKKMKKTGAKKKVEVIKKEQKVKSKIELPKTDKQLKRKETEDFRKCEEKYLRFICKWDAAIKAENVDRLRLTLTEANKIVGDFCSSFILSYDLSTMMKQTKQVLKQANEDLAGFIALKDKLKATFETKRALVPNGYIAPKRSYTPNTMPESKKSSNDSNIDVSDHGKTNVKLISDTMNSVEPTKSLSQSSASSSTLKGIPTTGKTNVKLIPGTIQSVEPTKTLSQSNASSSSLKAIPTTGVGVRNNSSIIRSDVPTNSSTAPKFKSLLGNIMQLQQQRPTSSQSSSHIRDETTTVFANNMEQIPSWATSLENIAEIPKDDDTRLFALEFLIQMARQFPDGLVNVDAMAQSLESAIYQWAKGNSDIRSNDDKAWVDRYWRKVHAIVAAFCGSKLEKGTFYALLLHGKFDTPNKIVNASDEKYDAAFEGKAVTI